ncbi:hypothetical protein [Aggregatibacter kilianii]|uniref:hypothetical protein n=1 Tax=Aggregatibacter kilianii TaxID=2025884 RepID=UPI000D656251|nr:hypothetical protein [Aggregatibacter kilianii]
MSAQARLTAHLLATARYVAVLNLVIFALSSRFGLGFFCLQILLCVALLYLHIRLYFDQMLFQDLAQQHITTEELDNALEALKLKMSQGDRHIGERIQGTLTLWKYVLYGTGMQFLLLFFAA